MDYKQLEAVNAKIKTTDIKGKAYAEVNERIKAFRQLFPNGTITTEIISLEGDIVIFKATALNEQGVVLATGHAYEKEGSTFINKTSYIENAETSAVGRCLGMLGIGIDTSVASAEEVQNAISNQKPKPNKSITAEDKEARTKFVTFCKVNNIDAIGASKRFNLTNDSKAIDFTRAVETLMTEQITEV